MEAKQLLDLVSRYESNREFITNEETGKMALVVPFVQLLGYDPKNPREVRLEYAADFVQGDGKRYADRMDFALFDQSGTKPLLVIETKPLGTDLASRCQQLARYIAQMPELHFGIITDGCRYLFYGDLESPNQMDSEPFFSFSLDDPKADWAKTAKFLSKFSRDAFNADTLVTDAENSRYRQAMIDKLASALRAPHESESFMRWLTDDIYKGKRTQGVRARLGEVAKDAVEPALLRFMSDDFLTKLRMRIDSLNEEDPSVEPAEAEEAPVADAVPEERTSKGVIETTELELKAFHLIQAICSHAGADPERVLYKDTVNYLNVSYERPTRWFLRLFSGSRRLSVVTRLPVAEAMRLVGDLDVEEAPSAFGVSRVYLDDVTQLWSLRELILRSLEVATASQGPSGSVDREREPESSQL